MAAAPEYRRRVIDAELDELATQLPALAIEGAKGVGKTATASRRAATIHALDDAAQRSIATADPERLLDDPPPVLVDEWQRVPEVWDLVRRRVDSGASPGQFLLTGSASPEQAAETHSGAGRIVSIRMRPLSLAERSSAPATVSLAALLSGERPAIAGRTTWRLDDYVSEILRSGLPGLRSLSGRALRAQLDGYLARIVDRDVPAIGHPIRNPAALTRWMRAYAAASSTTTSFEKIRDAAMTNEGEKPSRAGTQPYRDALERLWILDPVPAWAPTRSRIRRLTLPDKHQLADPAFVTRLLGVDARALLSDGSLLGALFESLVTLSARVYAQHAEASVAHLRTGGGEHEIDLIVVRGDDRVVGIEIKLARDIGDHDVRHLHWLRSQIGDDLIDAVVITTGPEAYRRSDGIAVIPASLLGP